MSIKQFELVKNSLFIPKEDLNSIRKKGFTVFTTYDFKRARNFTQALKKCNIN